MRVLAFGEVMMRVAPEGNLRLRQVMPGRVEVTFAGGEANVCAALALLGAEARYLTALPKNALADAVIANLRAVGVETEHIVRLNRGRLGIFFLETGANQRSSNVIYDRDGSSIALARMDEYNFDEALMGMNWLHITGITPALSENAYLSTRALLQNAKNRGLSISCDLNFRRKLWRWKNGYSAEELANECMSSLLPFADLLVANEEDAKDVLGIKAEGTSVEEGILNAAAYESVARAIVSQFPNVKRVAITLRESVSADHNNWGGMLYVRDIDRACFAPTNRDGQYEPYSIRDIVDRVGGGDSFAAGLIYALNREEYRAPETAISFAVAASCLKHSIKGDFNYITKEEVVALMRGVASGRVRR